MIVLGSILVIMGFLGCCGAMKQVKVFLIIVSGRWYDLVLVHEDVFHLVRCHNWYNYRHWNWNNHLLRGVSIEVRRTNSTEITRNSARYVRGATRFATGTEPNETLGHFVSLGFHYVQCQCDLSEENALLALRVAFHCSFNAVASRANMISITPRYGIGQIHGGTVRWPWKQTLPIHWLAVQSARPWQRTGMICLWVTYRVLLLVQSQAIRHTQSWVPFQALIREVTSLFT